MQDFGIHRALSLRAWRVVGQRLNLLFGIGNPTPAGFRPTFAFNEQRSRVVNLPRSRVVGGRIHDNDRLLGVNDPLWIVCRIPVIGALVGAVWW